MKFDRLAFRLPSWQTVVLWLICIVCVWPYASYGRGIWFDEFLHFAMGSIESTEEAWRAITRSTANVNHGQTGVYMLLNYWSIKLFGTSAQFLRAPSLLSACFLYYFASIFLKLRGYDFKWQIFVIFVLFCQFELFYFSGEARPYMPLAAATVGTLVYASANAQQRTQSSIRFIGIFSVFWGALIHPYFALYWLVVFVFGFWMSCFNYQKKFCLSDLISFFNFPLCLAGAVVYFGVASETWLYNSLTFDRDPFLWIKRENLFWQFIEQHTPFVGSYVRGKILLIIAIISPVIFIFLPTQLKPILRPLVPPTVLILIAIFMSILLSLISYFQQYWILTRQWVGSFALLAVAFAWLCAESVKIIVNLSPRQLSRHSEVLGFSVIVLCCWHINLPNTMERWKVVVDSLKSQPAYQFEFPPEKIICPISVLTWVDLANKNINSQTPIWPIFKYFYNEFDNPFCER
jgi:hypothetical protein